MLLCAVLCMLVLIVLVLDSDCLCCWLCFDLVFVGLTRLVGLNVADLLWIYGLCLLCMVVLLFALCLLVWWLFVGCALLYYCFMGLCFPSGCWCFELVKFSGIWWVLDVYWCGLSVLVVGLSCFCLWFILLFALWFCFRVFACFGICALLLCVLKLFVVYCVLILCMLMLFAITLNVIFFW